MPIEMCHCCSHICSSYFHTNWLDLTLSSMSANNIQFFFVCFSSSSFLAKCQQNFSSFFFIWWNLETKNHPKIQIYPTVSNIIFTWKILLHICHICRFQIHLFLQSYYQIVDYYVHNNDQFYIHDSMFDMIDILIMLIVPIM